MEVERAEADARPSGTSGVPAPEVRMMQGVVVYEVAIKPGREADKEAELDMVVERSKADPDFVDGWWFGDDRVGFAVQIVTDEAAARRAAESATVPDEAAVTLTSATAYRLDRRA